jgi:hypothetical protein
MESAASRIPIAVDDLLRRSGVASTGKEGNIVKEQDLKEMKDGQLLKTETEGDAEAISDFITA